MGFKGTYLFIVATVLSSCLKQEVVPISSTKKVTQFTPLSVPHNVAPTPTKGVSKVAVGIQHHCAIRNGDLYCWGLNSHGQIGNGESSLGDLQNPKVVSKPFLVLAGQVTDVSVGFLHTCAIQSSILKCWGSNEENQLAVSKIVDQQGMQLNRIYSKPQDVMSSVKQLSLQGNRSCFVYKQGNLKCYGASDFSLNGQELLSLKVHKVALSSTHLCALLESGSLKCRDFSTQKEWHEHYSTGVVDLNLRDSRTCVKVNKESKTIVECVGTSLGDREKDLSPGSVWREVEQKFYEATYWKLYPDSIRLTTFGALVSASEDLLYGSYFHYNGVPRKIAEGIVDVEASEGELTGCMMFRNTQMKCWGSNTFGQWGMGFKSPEDTPMVKAKDVLFD